MAMGMGMMMGSSSTSTAATVAVEKATSDLLIGPDWTMNMDICDSVNSHNWQAKDVVKAVKKRLQHKNPKVQLLALTLLETMVKNCGEYVHFQIAEKNILGEMVKIVKKKTDMHVRDKILVLLDSWQEAFGGPGGKHAQYYWAYDELRRFGVEFPQRSPNAAPIFTPPASNSSLRLTQPGYGMPSNSTRTLDETMAAEIEGLSLSSLEAIKDVMDLLGDMLQAVNPGDREAVKDDVIVDLVNRCRSNQKRLMHMLTTTGDEALLLRGLDLNDGLQFLLAKHDAIISGSSLPIQVGSISPKPGEGYSSDAKQTEVSDQAPTAKTILSVAGVARDEEEEEEDDFAQLARRHSKAPTSPAKNSYQTSGDLVPVETSQDTSSGAPNLTPSPSNVLAVADPPALVRSSKEQDMIDLLSMALTITQPEPAHVPPVSDLNNSQMPSSSSSTDSYAYGSQNYPANQGQIPYNNYVVSWAQPQLQHQPQLSSQANFQPQNQQQMQVQSQAQHQMHAQPQFQTQQQMQVQSQSQEQMQAQPQPQQQSHTKQHVQSPSQPQLQPQIQQHLQPQYPQYSTAYPPPPWAATPGFANGQNMYSTPRSNAAASYTARGSRPIYHNYSVPARVSSGSVVNGDSAGSSGPRNSTVGQRPFIPSYRLFEDLDVLGNGDGRYKMNNNSSPSLSGTSSQGMVSGQK